MARQQRNLIFKYSIGDVVRAWRIKRGLTLAQLAEQCNSTITRGYLSQLENNRIDRPNDRHLIDIASALSIPVLDLIQRCLPTEQNIPEGKQEPGEPV